MEKWRLTAQSRVFGHLQMKYIFMFIMVDQKVGRAYRKTKKKNSSFIIPLHTRNLIKNMFLFFFSKRYICILFIIALQ